MSRQTNLQNQISTLFPVTPPSTQIFFEDFPEGGESINVADLITWLEAQYPGTSWHDHGDGTVHQ